MANIMTIISKEQLNNLVRNIQRTGKLIKESCTVVINENDSGDYILKYKDKEILKETTTSPIVCIYGYIDDREDCFGNYLVVETYTGSEYAFLTDQARFSTTLARSMNETKTAYIHECIERSRFRIEQFRSRIERAKSGADSDATSHRRTDPPRTAPPRTDPPRTKTMAESMASTIIGSVLRSSEKYHTGVY